MSRFFALILIFSYCAVVNATPAIVQGAMLYSTNQNSFSFYPAQLCNSVNKIQQVEQVRELIAQVQKKGRVGIQLASTGDFEAMWLSEPRVISINPNRHVSESTMIVSLLFELHNAASDDRFHAIIREAKAGKIDKDTFVYSIEKMEHENCLKTCAMIEEGVKLGIFPKETKWDIFHHFEEHYQVQQLSGHSLWLAKSYEKYNPAGKFMTYQGTIAGLNTLNRFDRSLLFYYLKIKNGLKSRNPMEVFVAHKRLQNEYTAIHRPRTYAGLALTHLMRKRALFQSVFSGMGMVPVS